MMLSLFRDQEVTVERHTSKKEQILSLFSAGQKQPEKISQKIGTGSSYVAKVLKEAGLLKNYFDLYTSTKDPSNTHSKLFANRLGFKTKKIAERSVNFLDRYYQGFKTRHDRTGQHQTLIAGLTMFNRARGIGKNEEASIYRQWIIKCLSEDIPIPA